MLQLSFLSGVISTPILTSRKALIRPLKLLANGKYSALEFIEKCRITSPAVEL